MEDAMGSPAPQGTARARWSASVSLLTWALAYAPPVEGPRWAAFPPRGARSGLKLAMWLAGLTGLFFATWGETRAFASLRHGGLQSMAGIVIPGLLVVAVTQLGRAPLWAWRWHTASLLLLGLSIPWDASWAWSITGLVLYMGVLMLVGERHDTPLLVGVWIVSMAVIGLSGRSLPSIVVVAVGGAMAAFLVIGRLRGTRAVSRGELDAAKLALSAESAHAAVLAERARIARELHDVVAHRMSMIAIQAEAAPLRFGDLPGEVVEAFSLINDAARGALAETRSIVGLLRSEDGEAAERAPAPTVEAIPSLVADASRGGLPVTVTTSGVARDVPAATGLAAFRIVQESLANAARHAPGQVVTVHLDYGQAALTITVRNSQVNSPPQVQGVAGDTATPGEVAS